MTTQLSVVNACLAIMGEAPLASLAEDHEFKPAILDKLTEESLRIQAKGWWFNMETIKLVPHSADNRVYLPANTASVVALDNRPGIVQRGRVLYDLINSTDKFDPGLVITARVIVTLPLEELPVAASSYISGRVVEWFQSQYDGDQTKTRNLMQTNAELLIDLKTEHIRYRKVNLLDSSARISRIRMAVQLGVPGRNF